MNEANRYAPPTAAVTDIDTAPDMPMPGTIRASCWLLWLSVAVGLVRTVVFYMREPNGLRPTYMIVSTVIGLGIGIGLVYWFTWAIRGGRNWMRWVLTVLWVLGAALSALAWTAYMALMKEGMIAPVVLLFEAAQFLMFTASVVLLHTRLAREWLTRDRY